MSSLLVATLVAVMAQQAPAVAPAEVPSQQLLQAAVTHMNARRMDSAAILLRRVAEEPTRLVDDRVRAWVMLGVVDHLRSGDSASAYALRQALILAPALEAPALEANFPDVARILAAERAALAPPPADTAVVPPPAAPPPPPTASPATVGTGAAVQQVVNCTNQCPNGVQSPSFTHFPHLDMEDSDANVGVTERRLRSFLLFEVVIGADGVIEPETVQLSGGTGRRAEGEMRRALAQARFTPGREGDKPVRTRVRVRFDFESEGTGRLKYTYRVLTR